MKSTISFNDIHRMRASGLFTSMQKVVKLFLLSLFVVAISASCGSGTQNKNDQSQVATELEDDREATSGEEITDCDEFLAKYEKWVDKYLVVLEKYKNNPMDPQMAQEFMAVGLEAAEWAEQWTQNHYACTSDEKYQKRFEAISDRVDKKMKELELDE